MNAALAEAIGKAEDFIRYDENRRSNVFKGTNIPVSYLWDDLLNGDTISNFISRYPQIKMETALNVVRLAASKVDGI